MITKNPRENLFWLNKVSSNRNFLRIKNKIIHACCRVWAYHRDYRILQESIESKNARNKNSNEIILNVSYNPKLLGGLILEYNSLSIDASILNEFSLFFSEV